MRAALNCLCQVAGLDESITPDVLRHRFATGVLAATHDLAATQDLFGHASPTTNRIYARLTDEDTAEAHREAGEEEGGTESAIGGVSQRRHAATPAGLLRPGLC